MKRGGESHEAGIWSPSRRQHFDHEERIAARPACGTAPPRRPHSARPAPSLPGGESGLTFNRTGPRPSSPSTICSGAERSSSSSRQLANIRAGVEPIRAASRTSTSSVASSAQFTSSSPNTVGPGSAATPAAPAPPREASPRPRPASRARRRPPRRRPPRVPWDAFAAAHTRPREPAPVWTVPHRTYAQPPSRKRPPRPVRAPAVPTNSPERRLAARRASTMSSSRSKNAATTAGVATLSAS
jgi:hypothetical protein